MALPTTCLAQSHTPPGQTMQTHYSNTHSESKTNRKIDSYKLNTEKPIIVSEINLTLT